MRVVYDGTLLVNATAFRGETWESWPSVPPYTNTPEQDCLGIIASSPTYGQDVNLLVSRELLQMVQRTLREEVGLLQRDIDDYLISLLHLATSSGGGVVADPPGSARAGHPPHVGVPLALTRRHAPGGLLVAAHEDVKELGPRWADEIHVISAREFAQRVDAARRVE